MRDPLLLSQEEFNDRLGRMVATQGDAERAGLALEDIRDMVHTRMKNLGVDIDPAKPKGVKKPKITAEQMDLKGMGLE